MRAILFSVCVLLPTQAMSAGLLGDITSELGRIADDVKITNPAISQEVYGASVKIERAALVQAIQEDALSKRIYALEKQVAKQQEIISKYERLVAELESKIPKVMQ
ncbi:hypothetical protein GV819_30000 [Pseudomonas sp. Fl5BN2]|uniref:hypothetical protein n=1 Tax=Pseudomonas sp. Fl5BN2 TaxID=2697652 RepID=UPI001376EDE9|nr:hypothetical protein [Pseudomonas sp. Fl5BN2]NBF06516.1 hypothetical protein [Pseudomonas sp. Fl5BN2]